MVVLVSGQFFHSHWSVVFQIGGQWFFWSVVGYFLGKWSVVSGAWSVVGGRCHCGRWSVVGGWWLCTTPTFASCSYGCKILTTIPRGYGTNEFLSGIILHW